MMEGTMSPRMRTFGLTLAAPATAVVFAMLLSGLVLLAAGSNPFTAFGDMLEHGLKATTFVDMLNRATPLYLSGIAAAIGFRMALFNIGVEGQYQLAAFFAAAAGGAIVLPAGLHLIFIIVVAMVVGALSTSSGTKEIEESGHMFNLNGVLEIFTGDVGNRELSGVLLLAILAGIGYHVLLNRSLLG